MVDEILTIVLDGAIYASWLFIVALGLTFVFGVLKILNIAHGGIYALGAYSTATLVPIFYSLGMPEQLVILAMLVSALAVAIVITPIMERGIQGSYTGSPGDMKELMELVRSGKVDPIPVEKRPACEANQTLDDLKNGKILGRAALMHD